MKKLSKRFLTLAIACVMAMAMAVPAFADFDNGTTHTYHIKNNTIAGDYVYLNLYGTGGVYASRDVTVYPRTTSDDQVWYITNKVRDVKKVYNSRTDTSGNRYTLNINTNTNNCNVYPDYSSNVGEPRGCGASRKIPSKCRCTGVLNIRPETNPIQNGQT